MPQSRGSMAVARELAPQPGERVLDLCAAPGAKTTHLAALIEDARRRGRRRAQPGTGARRSSRPAARMHASCVRVELGDAAEPRADRRFRPGARRPAVQRARHAPVAARPALAREPGGDRRAVRAPAPDRRGRARRRFGPGGVLVYSVCTISSAESGRVIDRLLARASGARARARHPAAAAPRRHGWVLHRPAAPDRCVNLSTVSDSVGEARSRVPQLRGAVAAADRGPRPLPLRLLPAALRARVGVPELRRALDDRADVEHRRDLLQPLQGQHAAAGLVRGPRACCSSAGWRRRSCRPTSRGSARRSTRCSRPARKVIHVDVMDGHFVPPITFGPLIVSALADRVHDAGAVIDVHLMIERPERQVEEFARAGADNITIHFEATPHVHYTLGRIREAGCTAGCAICPATPAHALDEVAGDALDLALCMSVNPGWGDRRSSRTRSTSSRRMRAALPDARRARGRRRDPRRRPPGRAVEAGANLLVAGSAVFGSEDPGAAYAERVAGAGAAWVARRGCRAAPVDGPQQPATARAWRRSSRPRPGSPRSRSSASRPAG